MQISIPFMQFRGGSSKGLYFLAEDLPQDISLRNEYLVKAMEGGLEGDPRQINGLGGATSLTSKAAIINKSNENGIDLEYDFIQIIVGKGQVSIDQTCGNILVGVLPFAIEKGIINANGNNTKATIKLVNTGAICEVICNTPNKKVEYRGTYLIDGVKSPASPIVCNYKNIEGGICGALFPTNNKIDLIDGIECTCIDNGMPVVILAAESLKLTGYEDINELEKNNDLKEKIEKIRLKAAEKMGINSTKTIPKVCLVSKSNNGALINTRMFIPHAVHEAIGLLAAVSVATSCFYENTVSSIICKITDLSISNYDIEHPSGKLSVKIEMDKEDNSIKIKNAGIISTARLLAKGEVFIDI